MPVKDTLKRIIPRPVWQFGSNSYWQWRNRDRHVAARVLSADWMHNKARLNALAGSHKGERCFLIGNGPSLRNTDLSLLKNDFTIGLNRIYLAFEQYHFKTSCLVSVNDLVLEQCHAEMNALDLPIFVTWRARQWFKASDHVHFLDTDFTGAENFSADATGRLYEGFTVTYVGMQLAYFMGFSEVILIGVDHNFATKGEANKKVISEGDDPNHFAPNYFGKGFVWQLPDLEGSERAYRLAKAAFEADGRSIVDATVDGKLAVFPKVDYTSLFN